MSKFISSLKIKPNFFHKINLDLKKYIILHIIIFEFLVANILFLIIQKTQKYPIEEMPLNILNSQLLTKISYQNLDFIPWILTLTIGILILLGIFNKKFNTNNKILLCNPFYNIIWLVGLFIVFYSIIFLIISMKLYLFIPKQYAPLAI